MKVFISSTVYDLIDVRAEVAECLREMGISPLMSDDKLSDFEVVQTENSIETCLLNVDKADEFIIILDQRYGPSLEKAGFDNLSATHLEYQRAKEKKKPIHMFVRDRLEADHGIWKKNKGKNLRLTWIKEDKDQRLFELLDEHSKLVRKSKITNWKTTFSNSVDLKSAIEKQYNKSMLEHRLVELIASNTFPILSFTCEAKRFMEEIYPKVDLRVSYTNTSKSTAFNCQVDWEDRNINACETITPGSYKSLQHISTVVQHEETTFVRKLNAYYESTIGISVKELHEFGFSIKSFAGSFVLITHSKLLKREYFRSEPILISIVDQTSK